MEGVNAKEQPRAPISPAHLVWSGRDLAPHPTSPARTQSLAQPSLTHTGAVVGPQLEAGLALAAEGAGQVHAAVLAVAVAALVYVWGGRQGQKSGRTQAGWELKPRHPQPCLCLGAGLGQIRQDSHTHPCYAVSGDRDGRGLEVGGDGGQVLG